MKIPSLSFLFQSQISLFLFLFFFFFLALFPNAFARPLFLEYPEVVVDVEDGIRVRCTSWRLLLDSNKGSPWKTIPLECGDYVKDYMLNKDGYSFDLESLNKEAGIYARSVELRGDGKDVWIFDIDETLLSNLPYFAQHGFGLEVFNGRLFDEWLDMSAAPAIESSLKLYNEILNLGYKVFLLSGRSEGQRVITEDNLRNAGFQYWDELILRGQDDQGKPATIYKSEKRSEMLEGGISDYWQLWRPME